MAAAHGGDAEQLRRLQLVTDAALAHLELDDLLSELLTRIRDVLEVDTTAILLLDESRGELVARAAVGLEEEVERRVRIPLGRGFAGRVAADRRPIYLADVSRADVVNPLLREKGIASMLGVPLLLEGRVLGVLHVGSLTPREFDAAETDLLEVVAARAAIAIEHARLYAAERAARKRLERIQAVTDAALAHLELDDLLGVLLPRIRETLSVDTCAILLVDPARNDLVARAAVGLEEEVERGVRVPVGQGFAGRVVAERRPILLSDVDHGDVLNPILREKGVRTLLGVPLVVRDEPLGVLHVGTLTPRQFDREEVDLLQLVGDRVAVAIEKARVHAEVVELDRLKLNFVAIASHELRTPATSVYGMLATLHSRWDAFPDEKRRELVDTAWEQGDRLRRLIEQLLDLSRLDAGAISIDPQPLVLRNFVDDLVVELDDGLEQGAVAVEVPHDMAVVADKLVLDRVLSNLLVNAYKYGSAPIVVAAEQKDRHLRISVEDAGSGVAPHVLPRLFERFERGTVGRGSGLGLSIAKAYALAHGGDLLYDRRGRGARFELVLPRTR